MAVCGDVSAVKAYVSCMSCRNDLDLRRDEILLLNTVLLEQDLQNACLEDLMSLLVISAGNSADDDVEILSGNEIRCLLGHLLIAEMRKEICDVENGIFFLLAYHDLVRLAVIRENDAVYSQRNRRPLILLEATVIVCLEVNGIVVLIDGIGLKIESGRIDVGTEDVKSFSRTLLADNCGCKALSLDALVNLVTGL